MNESKKTLTCKRDCNCMCHHMILTVYPGIPASDRCIPCNTPKEPLDNVCYKKDVKMENIEINKKYNPESRKFEDVAQWIKPSDELPSEGVSVLCAVDDDQGFITPIVLFRQQDKWLSTIIRERGAALVRDHVLDKEVLYWTYLPSAPTLDEG